MTAYTKSTNFATKDTLTSGDPLKIVKGTEINTEFDNIATAVNSKSDTASPTFTGTVTIPTLSVSGTAAITGVATLTANPVLSAGTANGVTYLNGSKSLTSGSALAFDGTNFSTTGTASASKLIPTGSSVTGNGLYLPATNALGLSTNGTNAVYIDASQNVGIGTSSLAGYRVSVKQSGNTALASIGIASINSANDTYIGMGYNATSDTCRILASYDTNGAFKPLTFLTSDAERMRIDSSGNLLVATTSQINPGSGTQAGINLNAIGQIVGSVNSDTNYFRRTGTDGNILVFYKVNSAVGGISVTASATAYATSSDYRLKENIMPMTGGLAKVSALKPVIYTWKSNQSDGQGFIAHELAEVVPQCVIGEKDAVDSDGNPVYQGIDTSFLVATLTAAIQEQQTLITALTARITALENK